MPVFLISPHNAYRGVISSCCTRLAESLFVLQGNDCELISLQPQRLHCIALVYGYVICLTRMLASAWI